MEEIIKDQEENLIDELPKGIFSWYPFENTTLTLLIAGDEDKTDIYSLMLSNCGTLVRQISVSEAEKDQVSGLGTGYDYIVLIEALERFKTPLQTLKKLKGLLKAQGRLLIAMDNRLGLRYLIGDQDPFTNRNFDGIENYSRINEADRLKLEGRNYSHAEAMKLAGEAGFDNAHSFSVFPCVENPSLIYAEDVMPNEELDVRLNLVYRNPATLFMEYEKIQQAFLENGMFHQTAGGYILECCPENDVSSAFNTIRQVTVSMDRGRKDALATIIKRNNTVVKKAIYPEGRAKLNTLLENDAYLRSRGLRVVEARLNDKNEYEMPYVKGESAVSYFRRLFDQDIMLVYRELKRFFELVLASSETVPYEEIDWYHYAPGQENQKSDDPNYSKWHDIAYSKPEALGKILRRGFMDLVSLNCFVVDGEFVFYDQEFCEENIPAYTILWRTIDFIYMGRADAYRRYPREKLCELMGLGEYESFYAGFSHRFIGNLRHWREFRFYNEDHQRNVNVINSNRQRMNYSQEEYQKLFVDIFDKVEGHKLYLFGSGNYAKKFISQFGRDYKIEGLLDNNSAMWGQDVCGLEVMNPDVLLEEPNGKFKVIICIKNYVPVLKQLRAMGIDNISFYDWNLEYRHAKKNDTYVNETVSDKPYHVGYVAGVFDLFHIGHLNLLRRAKEQCDYLIVGVVSDEGVISRKKTTPYIPFEERLQIVQACEYVDEAVMIPIEGNDSDEAYRRYQFDVQFSGSDYADDPDWLAKQAYLRKRGSDLVFFPYTQGTSSTKLKAVISANQPNTKSKASAVPDSHIIDITIDKERSNKMRIVCMTNPAIDPFRPMQGMKIHRNAGYEAMALGLRDYCSPIEITNIGRKVIKVDVQRRTQVTDDIKLLWQYGMEDVRGAKEAGLSIPLVLTPLKAKDADSERTDKRDLDEPLYELALRSIELAREAGAEYIVIYPNSYDQMELDIVTAWYDRLISAAREAGLMILVPNQSKDVYGHQVRGIFTDTEELSEWIDSQNAKYGYEAFGACMDIGDYNMCGMDLKEVVLALDKRIKAIIMRENNGDSNSAMLPFTAAQTGVCNMDYLGLIRGLRMIDYEGLLVLDMFDTVSCVPTKMREGVVNLSKQFMDFMAWQIGMEKGLKKYKNRVLFGAGNMCRAYMKCYGEEFPPLYTCDNNSKLWNTEFCGLTIKNPENLLNLPEDCVIYICNMYYNEIKEQLTDMGVTNPIEFFNDEYLPSYHFTRI